MYAAWMDDRFAKHMDSPLLRTPTQKAIATNYDWLADNASADLAMAYLVRTVSTSVSGPINNTGMAYLLGATGSVVNAYLMGGSANFPMFTIDQDGVTLRVGRPRPNWLRKLFTDDRPSYTLPVVDPTKVK